MISKQAIHLLSKDLARRRRALGMPYDVLAARSGVSEATLKRMLTGSETDPAFSSVAAAAAAMGFELQLKSLATPTEMQRRQAERKARQGVARTQATSGLETQALSDEELNDMIEQAIHDWMAGSRRKLWAT